MKNSWKSEALLNEKVYKSYKSLFNPKKATTHNATTQRWTTMKEINGQAKRGDKSSFPAKLKTDSKIKTGEDEIANEFNKYFANIGSSLAKLSLIHRCCLKVFWKEPILPCPVSLYQ